MSPNRSASPARTARAARSHQNITRSADSGTVGYAARSNSV